MAGPLEGLKVLELIRVPPGAFCTMMLADMGAEVVKIETPVGAPPEQMAQAERRAAFQFVNRNKRSIAINLKRPDGQKLLHQLAADADVLVEGFRPGVMARLGGDYETLKRVNPRLIFCSLSGYGQDGPYRDQPAHDVNFLSIAGILNLIGETRPATSNSAQPHRRLCRRFSARRRGHSSRLAGTAAHRARAIRRRVLPGRLPRPDGGHADDAGLPMQRHR